MKSMKQKIKNLKTLLLLLCLVAGVNVSWATDIPLTVGTYLTTSESVTTGTINNNDGGNLGGIYKDATATFTLTNASAQDMVLTFLTGNNNSSNPRVTVTMNDGSQDFFSYTVDIENTGAWTPITKHVFDVGNVPAGTITLKFAFTNTSSYVCNLGSIGVYNKADYIASLDGMPGDITLSKGSYQGGARYNDSGNGKVGWLSNNTYCYYPDLYVTAGGKATLNIGMTYNGDGTLNVKIVDATTGVTEVNKNISVTSSDCNGLTTPTSFELDNITAGFKTLKLTMSTEASYLIDYQDLSLSIESWTPIAIDLRSGQLGTSGSDLQKYLTIDGETYNYADADPGSYNALLSASSFNGTDHGYVSFKAKVPVKTGIYKITLGTCQYGTGTGYVKNADESSTLTIVDENGQEKTSFNQNTGACYHNNTTENVVSMWYTASSDETITIVCGNYTPYFAIEKVNAVPELKYAVTYAKGDGVEGTVPSVEYATAGNAVTLPVNRTLYKEGYTLTGWNDGVTTYEPGDSYTPAANVTLNAVFTANTYTFDQTVSEMTVRWDFQRQNGCPLISKEGATAILVQQANVNGNTIDMKLDINATSGKFANGSWTDWAQVNEGTTFSFPSVDGTTVKAYSMNEPKNGSDVKSSVDGNEYSSYASYIATYATTPTSSSSTMTVKGGTYYRYIDVTYPAAAITGITELTVDGVAVGSDIILAINTGDAYTATLSGNTYTTVPTVQATFDTSAQAAGVASGTGTSRTYTVNDGNHDYTLIVEGIHVYSKGISEETINLKYTGDGNDKENKIWTNGVYSVSPVGDGWNNSGFKLKASEGPFTLSVPSDVQVKQFVIHEFKDNYTEGSFNTITSTGMTTAYIPTKHNLPNTDGEKYDLIINLDDHQAGKDIVFSFTGGSQITGWYELTVAYSDPGTAPVKTAENVTIVNNHAVVAVTFDREISGNVNATINETTVTAEGGASTLYFPVWDLSYSTNYTLTIAAGAVTDNYGNSTSEAINIAVNVPAKAAVAQATYDYVVSTASEFSAAITAVNSSNTSSSAARKTIFIKNGDYNFGSTEQKITGYNVSLIGESRDGVVLHGNRTGISNPVLNIRDRSGFYLQDLTVKNDYDYGTGSFNGVAVAIYGGNKTVMKNVRMLSNQDTQVTGERAYFEDCEIHGTVDFICGGGDNFYYHTNLVLENRGGNCITAPSTNSSLKWGYVFQECTIDGVDATAASTNANSYTLGRPWQNEPRCYYLNTTMNVLPAANGWAGMGNLPTHFYEYNSMNSSSVAIDLSGRTNSPTSTNSYSPVLTAEQAAKFTLQNVLGGTDSWLPTEECVTLAAPASVSISGTTLSWDAVTDARCYVIFKDGEYYANQTGTSLDLTDTGVYTVKAANLNGGLGTVSSGVTYAAVVLNEAEDYTPVAVAHAKVTLTRSITAGNWSTIVLPFDIASGDIETIFGEGASVAEFTGGNANTLNFTTTLTDDKMNANQPYAIKVATNFSSATISGVTIIEPATPNPTQNIGSWGFEGNYSTPATIPEGSYYFKSNKLYQAGSSGTHSIKPFRAYFTYMESGSARELNFVVDGETTGIADVRSKMEDGRGEYYNLNGQRVDTPTKGLYIVNGKKVVIK